MILLIDTDIILDVGLKRAQFYDFSASLIRQLELNPKIGKLSWHAIANIYYLLRPKSGKSDTREFISALLKFVEVPEVGHKEVRYAIDLEMTDFEDALQASVAVSCKAEYIVTRNIKDFSKSPVKAILPEKALKLF